MWLSADQSRLLAEYRRNEVESRSADIQTELRQLIDEDETNVGFKIIHYFIHS